jgi:hypothetical protein
MVCWTEQSEVKEVTTHINRAGATAAIIKRYYLEQTRVSGINEIRGVAGE